VNLESHETGTNFDGVKGKEKNLSVVIICRGRRGCGLCSAIVKLNSAINVLHNENGPVSHGNEQPPEVGIGLQLGELQVIDIKAQEISHSSNQTGFAGARRSIEQVPSLPSLPNLSVILLPRHKPLQIPHHKLLHVTLQSQRVKGGGVVQIDPSPGVVGVSVNAVVIHGEDPQGLRRLLQGLGLLHYEGKVCVEDHVFVLLVEAQFQGPNLRFQRRVQVARVVEVPGLHVTAHQDPVKLHAVKDVVEALVALHCEDEGVVGFGFGHLESLRGGGDFGAEVGLRGLVDLVAHEAVELLDHHRCLRREPRQRAAEAVSDVGHELRREELTGHRADHHCSGGHRGRRGEDGLGGGEV